MLARRPPLPLAFVAALALLVGERSGHADVLKVPKQYGTIQSAIDASGPGDVVEVAGGVYVEDLVIEFKSGLTLRAKDDATVIVDAGGAGHALRIGPASHITVERIRFRNSLNGAGVAVTNDAAYVRLTKCRVTGTLRGIQVVSGEACVIRKCIVQGVTLAAIELADASTGAFVSKNQLGDFGTGIQCQGALHTIEENVLSGQGGAGIVVTSCERACVAGNEVEGALDGIVLDNSIDCSVVGNVVTGGAAGVRVNASAVGPLVEKNKVVGNVHGVISFADGLRLTGNTAKKCKEVGFSLSGERLLVHRNLALKSKHGFDVFSSDASYLGNVAELSGAAGLYVSAVAHGNNLFVACDFDSVVTW